MSTNIMELYDFGGLNDSKKNNRDVCAVRITQSSRRDVYYGTIAGRRNPQN